MAAPEGCDWCGAKLTGRARRWCSTACSTAYWENHGWNEAREAAKRRDGNRCVRCGHDPHEERQRREEFAHLLCLVCGPVSTWAPSAQEAYWMFLRVPSLEVNHINPVLGRHAVVGCHHHLDGLETLCHRCHVEETARQFGHRRASAPEPSLFEQVA
ncbi:MAG TPA: hypothetical protein VGB14_19715 [Acidimicrobiales bacterium]|jgi:hypothetical protein